jgi:hypothetical protein
MRFACGFLTLVGCVAFGAFGQSPQPTASQLDAFERFAKTSIARVARSREIGRIDTDRARAVFTTLTVEVSAKQRRRMRGI